MQILEDEPGMEIFENMHSVDNGLRETAFNEGYFEAWEASKTGYPMVHACMRALRSTGWLSFRMRAMLMSFARLPFMGSLVKTSTLFSTTFEGS